MPANDQSADPIHHGVARRAALAGLIGAMSSLAGISRQAHARSNRPPAFGTARSQFTLLDPVRIVPSAQLTRMDGTTTNLAAFRGKVVLVNFWATWCAACQLELPVLDRLQEKAAHKNLKVVAVSLDRHGRSVVSPFAHKLKLRHLDIYLDPEGRIGSIGNDNEAAPFPIYGMPISYVIGPAGHIEGYVTGEADWSSGQATALLDYYLKS